MEERKETGREITKEFATECGYLLWKPYGDGCEAVGLRRMYGTQYRLQLFDMNAPFQNYCFHSLSAAVMSFMLWQPETMGDCPAGWVKHIETNRCRPDGDPKKESIGWPLPPLLTPEEKQNIQEVMRGE